MVAPAFWRRAVRLDAAAHRGLCPLSLAEMPGRPGPDPGRIAMATRRLEMISRVARPARRTSVEIARVPEVVEGPADRARGNGHVPADDLAPREEVALQRAEIRISFRSNSGTAVEQASKARSVEFKALDAALEEQTFMSSSRQVELAGREFEIERLTNDLARLRRERQGSEERQAALEAELARERKAAAELKRNFEAAAPGLADSLPAGGRSRKKAGRNGGGTATQVPAETPAAGDDELKRLAAERDRLEGRLTTLTRENKRLRTAGGDGAALQAQSDAALRDQIQQLAAEVVTLAARLEGPDSAIAEALSQPVSEPAAGGPDRRSAWPTGSGRCSRRPARPAKAIPGKVTTVPSGPAKLQRLRANPPVPQPMRHGRADARQSPSRPRHSGCRTPRPSECAGWSGSQADRPAGLRPRCRDRAQCARREPPGGYPASRAATAQTGGSLRRGALPQVRRDRRAGHRVR